MKNLVFIIVFVCGSLLPGVMTGQTATLKGSLFNNNSESDVRNGGGTIEIKLNSASWADTLGDDNQITKDLINGFTGDQNWAVVTEAMDHTHVDRTNDNQVRITLPAVAGYFIPNDETVTLTIPSSCFKIYSSTLTATPSITILNQDPVVSISGSIQDGTANTEADIRDGNSGIILSINGDQWNEDIGTNSTVTEDLINNIYGSTSWSTTVIPSILGSDKGASNVSLAGNEVTISIPSVIDYNITEDDNLSVEVPSLALKFTDIGTYIGSPSIAILSVGAEAIINDPGLTESTLSGSSLNLSLSDEEFADDQLDVINFSHNGPAEISIDSVDYVDLTEAVIYLGLTGELVDDVNDFRITVNGQELAGGNDLTTNGIGIISEVGPFITDVAINQGTYIIGDSIQVSISVEDDQGIEFSYLGGTVAEKELVSLQRESNQLYTGIIIVSEDMSSYGSTDPIPVSNLQLANGAIAGNVYDGFVSNNIIIDTEPPVINYMQAPSGVKIVGEQVDIIVSADGENYTAVETNTSVNNISLAEPNVAFLELGNGVYILRYRILEGDNDVSSGSLTASLQLQEANGNVSSVSTNLTLNTVIIDANSPVVEQISVDNEVYNVGDIIEMDIVADGSGYSATNETYINNVPLSSSSVSFTNVSGNNYRISYEVRAVDPEVLPGNLKTEIYLRDAAGNVGGPYSDIEPNTLSIYTDLPSAILTGNPTICEGEEAKLTVSLTGRAPWRIYLSDGGSNSEYEISNSPHTLKVTPPVTTTYTIDSVIDVNGTSNIGAGSATVTVRPKIDVEIVNLNSSYYIEADPVQLEADTSGGIFSGPGVNSSTGIFDPGLADTVNSPHTIYYSFTNSNGCVSIDSALVFVLGAQGDLFIPQEVYCDYNEPFRVSASNVAEDTGSFKLYDEDRNELNAITDNGDNTATIDPSILEEGVYYIEYKYFDGTSFFIERSFRLESVTAADILIPDQDEYCQSEDPFLMDSSDPAAVFSGPGVTGNLEDGFVFVPDSAFAGENTITLTSSSPNGCEATTTKTITVIQMPDLDFSADKLCLGNNDTVRFTNTSRNKDLISEWSWDFDDPDNQDADTSSSISPSYVYGNPDSREITLIATSESGCADTLTKTIEFQQNPVGSFNLDSECFKEGKEVSLISNMSSNSSITNYEWTITDPEGNAVVLNEGPTTTYEFSSMDRYTIKLSAETSVGCSGSSEKVVLLKPTYTIGDTVTEYFEDFSEEEIYWSTGKADSSGYMSWDYRTVDFAGMNGNESQAWFTNLPDSLVMEYSWVKSPCFNLSEMTRPMIIMDIHRSLDRNNEGVVLQSTTDGGQTWNRVGDVNSGVNWYNSSSISPAPGGSNTGWTGELSFNPDTGWVESRHDLGALAGKDNVQLRIAFSSDHDSRESLREGFAFDNVQIKERNKKVLLEHFTNTASLDTREVNGRVNSLYNLNFANTVKLEYHTSFPGQDPFNEDNPSVPATRSFYYGISQVPYSIIDGGYSPDLRVSYDKKNIYQADLLASSLQDAGFDIQVAADYTTLDLVVDIDVTALKPHETGERIVHVVIYEKLITGVSTINGATRFLNVVKDMLPNSAGTAEYESWEEGETRSYQFMWDYKNVYDPEMIRVAAFIQDDVSREVYQVNTDDTTNLTTSRKENIAESFISVYPNPADHEVFIRFDGELPKNSRIELIDQLGRIASSAEIYPHQGIIQLDVSELDKGIYFIRLKNAYGKGIRVEKLIIF